MGLWGSRLRGNDAELKRALRDNSGADPKQFGGGAAEDCDLIVVARRTGAGAHHAEGAGRHLRAGGRRGGLRELDPDVELQRRTEEGVWREAGEVLELRGAARALLSGERTALNFLAHLSGVATAAARAARIVEGTGTRVLDTRKTTPGLRALEKAAVAAGGATNHRVGLYDAILIKENHIAAAGGITAAIERARAFAPALADTLEVEVRNGAEIDEALAAGAPRLLLDNMSVTSCATRSPASAGRPRSRRAVA